MKKITIEDLTKFKFPSTLKKNRSEEKIAFLLYEMNVEENKYLSNLWIMDTATEELKKFTSDGKTRVFYWEDDKNILLQSSRADDEKKDYPFTSKFFRLSLDGGEAEETFTLPIIVKGLETIKPDELYLVKGVFKIGEKIPLNHEKEEIKEAKEKLETEKDYEVLTEIPYWSDGSGYTDKKRTGLFIFNKKEGSFRRITEDMMSVELVELSESKDKVLFTGGVFKDKLETFNDAYTYDMKSDKTEKISPDADITYSDAIFLDENTVLTIATDRKMYGLQENKKFYRLSIQNKELECVTPELDMSFSNLVVSDSRFGAGNPHTLVREGEFVYFTSIQKNSSFLYRTNTDGDIEMIIDRPGSLDHFCILKDKIIEIAFRGTRLPEIYSYKTGKESRISNFNEWIQNEKKYSEPESIVLKREGKPDIEGWVIKPVDFMEGKKYPAILDIHGGPKGVYGEIFFCDMQVWVACGYCVFFCNPRGSDGKGNEFADIRGKYGTVDYDDIMEFTDLVLEKYDFIDEERMGVTGRSYGGYMTNWIIGHTDRFKAGVSESSSSNWISKLCTQDIGYLYSYDQCAGNMPWDNYELLWESSPLKYADKAKTPTLFIHSEEDYRCPYSECFQMFTALKYYGVKAKVFMFRGESHELSTEGKPKHRIRRLQEIQDWFDSYLK